MYNTLISVECLQQLQVQGQPLMVFDCSFELMQPAAGPQQYEEKHVAGAVYAHLDTVLSAKNAPDAASGGRHPLPSRETVAAWLGSVGFSNKMQAVVYDRQGVNYCGRLWWMLKWAGHEAVAVLDGGWQAWQAAGGAVQSGPQVTPAASDFRLLPSAATLIDAGTVRMVNAHSNLGLREEHLLLMEFHGSPASVKEQAETVQDIASENHGHAFEWATTPEERTRLWTARHNAYFAAIQTKPGCRAISTDTCVPISRLADCLLDSVAEADASGIPYFLVGHVGDGNFHFGYLIDPAKPEEREAAERLNQSLVARALRLEGTCTGEHGVGLHKMDFLVTEAGAGAVDMMRTLKRALDPKNIMNPGKIFST